MIEYGKVVAQEEEIRVVGAVENSGDCGGTGYAALGLEEFHSSERLEFDEASPRVNVVRVVVQIDGTNKGRAASCGGRAFVQHSRLLTP